MSPKNLELGQCPTLSPQDGPPTPSGVVEDPVEGEHESSLPPADYGRDAWLFLFASFVMEGLVWGFPFAFGVFQDYYKTHEPFSKYKNIASIGTCALGLMYLSFPIVIALQRLYPRACRWAPTVGIFIMCFSLVMCSFSQTLPHLILTQGILYALAGCMSYCPCMLYLEEWFIQRRGLAFGIMWSGTGIGGFLIPLVLEILLRNHGFELTLRIWAVALFVLTMPLVYFIKPRLPASATAHMKPYRLGFVFNRTFILYQTASIVESLGFFLPTIYLPTYARSILNAGPFLSALTVILINVNSAIGTIILGLLTDKWHVTTCIMISTVGAVVGTFFLWGFAANMIVLYAFCVVYGLFAGSYVSTWPAIIRQVVSSSSSSGENASDISGSFDPSMVLGLLTAGRGIGNIVSGPLSEFLLKASNSHGQGISGEYKLVIAFTGSTAVVGGATFIYKRLGWIS